LNRLVRDDEVFATGICGLVDVSRHEVRLIGAGNPPALLVRATGLIEQVECVGAPLGVVEEASYHDTTLELQASDCLLLFSDGAVEIHNAENKILGVDGLIGILKTLGYSELGIQGAALEEELLKYSNSIRLEDDLTLIEVRFSE
jgi:serine phosphatase RsbU (regulator of sigma subunit)